MRFIDLKNPQYLTKQHFTITLIMFLADKFQAPFNERQSFFEQRIDSSVSIIWNHADNSTLKHLTKKTKSRRQLNTNVLLSFHA